MRKIMLSAVACCAVIAILPASALAHGHHHWRHHHRGHHARIHQWGHQGTSQNQNQTAGTVQSFTGGVLTIALTNGQTVSGQVTGDTEIRCEPATTTSTSSLRSHDRGDWGGDDQGQSDNDNDDNVNASCSSSDLTSGAVVREAELRVSSAGAVWDKVELVTPSSQSSAS